MIAYSKTKTLWVKFDAAPQQYQAVYLPNDPEIAQVKTTAIYCPNSTDLGSTVNVDGTNYTLGNAIYAMITLVNTKGQILCENTPLQTFATTNSKGMYRLFNEFIDPSKSYIIVSNNVNATGGIGSGKALPVVFMF